MAGGPWAGPVGTGRATEPSVSPHRGAAVPETTETATVARPADATFRYLADFGNLAEWDPQFDRSERLDDGPLGVGSRFEVEGSAAGKKFVLEMRIVTYDEPTHVVLQGTGDGIRTEEDIRVAPVEGGSEVTYHASFETDAPDWLDAAGQPIFTLVGKRTMSQLTDVLGEA
ncbi:hypothetical protein FTX61_18090 [Nitriliruptoraceae bacterium ZYF776]|nr:hypothetical protein [Profundirhabdus halotolerans]